MRRGIYLDPDRDHSRARSRNTNSAGQVAETKKKVKENQSNNPIHTVLTLDVDTNI
jgi:hypothetical protein